MADGLSAGKVSMKVIADTAEFGETVKKGLGEHESFFGEYGKKIGETLLAGFAVLGIGDKIAEYVKGGVEEYEVFDRMNAQFAAGIKSTGNAANLSVKSMDDLAESIAEYSGQSVESIGKTEQVLQTFTAIKNVGPNRIFDDATKAAANMAAKLGGDASASAIQLGKALNDPVKGMTALRRVGVSFTDAQQNQVKAMVKAGDTMSAQKVILKELNTEFGGAAKAAGETFPGQIARAKVAVGNLEKDAVTPFMHALPGLLDGVISTVVAITPKVEKASEEIANYVIPKVQDIAKRIGLAFSSNTGNFSNLGGAVKGLIGAFVPLVPVVQALRGTFPSLGKLIGALVPALTAIIKAITPLVSGFSQWLASVAKTKDGLAILKTVVATAAAAFLAFKIVPGIFAAVKLAMNGAKIAQGIYTAFVLTGATAEKEAAAAKVVIKAAQTALTEATEAGGIAAKAAAVGQWILNAAMEANPIGLLVIAITALVAGLVYFFTQTKLGQQIWANFTRFLGEAWTNVVAVVSSVWSAIVGFFQQGYAFVSGIISTIVSFIQQHWQLLAVIFLGVLGIVIDLVVTHFTQIRSFISSAITFVVNIVKTGLNAAHSVFSTVFAAIHSVVSTVINAVKSVINTVIGWISTYIKVEVTIWKTIFTTVWDAIKSVTSTVFGAVKGIVSGVISAVSGFFNGAFKAIEGIVSGVWSSVNAATGGALSRFTSAVSGAIGKVTAFFGGIAGKITGAIGDAGTMLYTIGQNIIHGLIQGLQSMVGSVGSFVSGIINSIPKAARDLLGIHSPSTVFAEIGKYIGQGLIVGLQGTQDDVSKAMTDLTQKVTDAFSKLVTSRTAAQKRLATLDRQLSQVHGNKQAANDRRANIRAEIADQKALLNAMKDPHLKATITTALKADTADLSALAAKRDSLSKSLADIQSKITDAVKVRDDFAANTTSEALGLGNIANAYTTAMQALSDASADTPTVNPLDAMIANLKDSVAKTDQFNAVLAQLKAQGLDDASYSQLVGAGVDTGLATAEAIEAGGPAAVKQISSLQAQLSTSATNLGTGTARALYQGGIDAMQAQANGYTSQIAVVTGAIGVVEESMAATVKKLGVDTSALTTQAGKDIGDGLAQGVKAKQGALEDVMSQLGKAMVKSIKKELKIKSPSRVMHELGGFTGEGFANGVSASATKVQSAVSSLMQIPTTSMAAMKLPEAQALGGGTVIQQTFTGQMGFTEEQVGDRIATKTRRGLQRSNLSRVPS